MSGSELNKLIPLIIYIVLKTSTANSRLMYAQTAVGHKEYFNHVFSIFKSYCTIDYTPYSKLFVDKRTNKSYSSISFTTMQLPCFNEYKNLFYALNVKKVPDNIYELLTPRGLAYWIQDDGSRQGAGLHLSVYARARVRAYVLRGGVEGLDPPKLFLMKMCRVMIFTFLTETC